MKIIKRVPPIRICKTNDNSEVLISMITLKYHMNGGKDLHEIISYRDSKGREPVLNYLRELSRRHDKDSRIKLNKISDYIQALSIYGCQLNENYMKHLEDGIWELRPMKNRILFAGIVGRRYVLLHQFQKRTRRTPAREIEKTKRELADFKKKSGFYEGI